MARPEDLSNELLYDTAQQPAHARLPVLLGDQGAPGGPGGPGWWRLGWAARPGGRPGGLPERPGYQEVGVGPVAVRGSGRRPKQAGSAPRRAARSVLSASRSSTGQPKRAGRL
jgi:hypothetical protein